MTSAPNHLPARVPDGSALAQLVTNSQRQAVGAIAELGGRVLLVGGSVRDLVLGVKPKDLDWEVHGVALERLALLLQGLGEVHEVGVSFGVLKVRLDGTEVDVALPRRESKSGRGHRGFSVEVDPDMAPREAAARRDFTWNAMAIDLNTGQFLDYFGGIEDLHRGILRHVGPAFAEDPLRVLRAMQFAARFGLDVHPRTARLCSELFDEYQHLAIERVWMEWAKWAEKGNVPSRGLVALQDTGWLAHYPELLAMVGCRQDPRYHPEGDVWIHTQLVCDAAARIAVRESIVGEDRLVLMFGALCHDLGKPATTVVHSDGGITSAGHAEVGGLLTTKFLEGIGFPVRLVPRVVSMVKEHMTHISIEAGGFGRNGIRRLARRLDAAGNTMSLLGAVVEADYSGRPPLPGGHPVAMTRCLEEAAEMDILGRAPVPILLGRHLLELGLPAGPPIGRVLRAAMEAQLDGDFADLDRALLWAREYLRTERSREE